MKKINTNSVPASFIVEELTDSENLIRFASFQKWLDGEQPFMVESRIERSLSASEVLPNYVTIERTVTGSSVLALIASNNEVTVGMEVGLRYTEFRVSAASHEQAQSAVDEIRKRAETAIDHSKIPIRVWTSHHGGSYDDRMLDSPPWGDIANNYPAAVSGPLADLMGHTQLDAKSPRLILWHGEPGTGKTTALRSLAREWEQWASVQYISDAEKLFEDSQYMAEVLDESARAPKGPTLSSASTPDETWRLIAAEDADEYLRSNARDRAGAALGRILNLSDGILGQHHNVVLLLTTNEEISRLHPALVRPGRCLANIEFTRFSVTEARRWLKGTNARISTPKTLAELLARRGDIKGSAGVSESSPPIGAYL